MNTNYASTEVNCPITGAKFTIVKNEFADGVKQFDEWVKDIIQRSNSGKTINIAFDCEGFNLGTIPNSLGCIQLGEIFSDSFNIKANSIPQNVGQKGGFIVFTPFNNETKENLRQIFNNRNVFLYSFDATMDLSAILDASININFENIFDSQVASARNASFYLFNTKIRGLKWFVSESIRMDQYASRAVSLLNDDKNNYFDITAFLFKDISNPEHAMIRDGFIQLAAADVYMTGLAALYCIRSHLVQNVLIATKKKMNEFNQFAQKCNSVLAPAVGREISFFNSYRASNYNYGVQLSDRSEQDLMKLLKTFRDCTAVINASKVLKNNYFGQLSVMKAQEIYTESVQKLDKNKSRLEQILSSIF